jgi:hypothetical protein
MDDFTEHLSVAVEANPIAADKKDNRKVTINSARNLYHSIL